MKKFKALFKKDPAKKPGAIECPGGMTLASTQAEIELYNLYFDIVDTDGDDAIGTEGAIFLNRSGLAKDQLREVWRIACGGTSKPKLDRANWLIALKLVAAAQAERELEVEALAKDEGLAALPPADVGVNNDPIVESDPVDPVHKAAIRTTVRDPHIAGSGMGKHTEYVVATSTSLPQFPRKEMAVNRRYRDFLWLHTRLCIKYPGNVIPRFPVKKVMGNFDTEFVEARREALEAYIDKVVHHPRLNQSFDLRMFLETTGRGFEALKEAVERQAHATGFGSSNAFSAMMKHITAGGGKDLDTAADEGYTLQLRLHSEAMHRLTAAVDASNNFLSSIRSTSDTYHQLGSQFGKMAIVEGEGASAGSGAAASLDESEKKHREKRMKQREEAKGQEGALVVHSAAHEAFERHREAMEMMGGEQTIEDMFNQDRDDPMLSGISAPAAQSRDTAKTLGLSRKEREKAKLEARTVRQAETLKELLAEVSSTFKRMSDRLADQADRMDTTFFSPLRGNLETEAELKEATSRRQLVVQRLKDVNAALHKAKSQYSKARGKSKPDPEAVKQAEADVNRLEKLVTSCQEELKSVTDGLTAEMKRVLRDRRANVLQELRTMIGTEAAQAKYRVEFWRSVLPHVSDNKEAIEESRQRMMKLYQAVAEDYDPNQSAVTSPGGEPEVQPLR